MSDGFEYVFPAIRGIQAQREYFVSMCPLRLLPRLFSFEQAELSPEVRAQRLLNKARIPELSRYIVENPEDYVFSAIAVSIDAEVAFDQLQGNGSEGRIGYLRIPMTAQFVINDGQHRRAAIERALSSRPDLGDETIAVVFFMDKGLERSQQMFADLNRYAVRPSKSLGILYDYRDEMALLAKELIARSNTFRELVELEKTSLALRSRRLFTLSAIYHATSELLADFKEVDAEKAPQLAVEFWETVADQLNEWTLVRQGKLTAGKVREEYIHTHGVVLQALARTGRAAFNHHPKQWKKKLDGLGQIDWKRTNQELWEGRALIAGRLSRAHQNVTLTANAIKIHLNLPLTTEEQNLEATFNQLQSEGDHAAS